MRSSVLFALLLALGGLAAGCTEPNPPGMGAEMSTSMPMASTIATRLTSFQLSTESKNYTPNPWKETANELSIQAFDNCEKKSTSVDLLCIFTSPQINISPDVDPAKDLMISFRQKFDLTSQMQSAMSDYRNERISVRVVDDLSSRNPQEIYYLVAEPTAPHSLGSYQVILSAKAAEINGKYLQLVFSSNCQYKNNQPTTPGSWTVSDLQLIGYKK